MSKRYILTTYQDNDMGGVTTAERTYTDVGEMLQFIRTALALDELFNFDVAIRKERKWDKEDSEEVVR